MKGDKYHKYLKEVEKKIIAAKPIVEAPSYFDLQKYIGTQFPVSGLSMGNLRSMFKEGYSFSRLTDDEQYHVWKYIWFHSNLHDAMSQAIFFCDGYIKKTDRKKFWKEIVQWIKRIDNWAHSDGLTHHYAALHEAFPDIVYAQLEKWNRSKNPWERRQSVLSLLDYARFRKIKPPFEKIRVLVENIISDEHYFVQKGIGWCLRETYLVYPDETFSFLIDNHNKITGTAFAAAGEKLKPKQKELLKEMRKKSRKMKTGSTET
ncbi:MAG: DNA alkylation repair protein [Chitinophagales bacterium]